MEKEILSRLEEIELKLKQMEAGAQLKQETLKHATISPDEIELGRMAFVGRYESEDGKLGSRFGADNIQISTLFESNSFEMAQVIDAFSSEDRINIVKILMQRSLTARELMEELKFSTTGKLYHHLSFLEKIGVIRKDCEQYHVSARYVSCVVLIFAGVQSIINKNNTNN